MELSDPLQHIRQSLHDLSQPLAAVTGLVDLLLLEMEEDSSFFKEVQMISIQLERVLTIVKEIRQIARQAADDLTKAQELMSLS
jgi:signal transduction histidine kinase